MKIKYTVTVDFPDDAPQSDWNVVDSFMIDAVWASHCGVKFVRSDHGKMVDE